MLVSTSRIIKVAKTEKIVELKVVLSDEVHCTWRTVIVPRKEENWCPGLQCSKWIRTATK